MEDTKRLQEKARSLTSVSPSRFTGLKACALREVWMTSGNRALLPVSPKARVGIIAHQLLTEAGRGQLPPDRAVIESRWVEKVQHAQFEIQQSSIEKHLLPLERSVPDLQVRRIRTVQIALDIAQESYKLARSPVFQGPSSMYGFELHVKSADGFVRGLIDCAICLQEGPLIRDYKSGEVFSRSDVNGREPKQEYQIQLKMYAALYAETFGKWPAKLEVVPLSGPPLDIPFSREDCTALVKEASELLYQINTVIASKPVGQIPWPLAHPSPASCLFCQYRPACQPYWVAPKSLGGDGWPVDVRGTVEENKILGNSKTLLLIRTEKGIASIPGLSGGERHPALSKLMIGDEAAVFNLMRVRASQSYSETSLTTIYQSADDPEVKN